MRPDCRRSSQRTWRSHQNEFILLTILAQTTNYNLFSYFIFFSSKIRTEFWEHRAVGASLEHSSESLLLVVFNWLLLFYISLCGLIGKWGSAGGRHLPSYCVKPRIKRDDNIYEFWFEFLSLTLLTDGKVSWAWKLKTYWKNFDENFDVICESKTLLNCDKIFCFGTLQSKLCLLD